MLALEELSYVKESGGTDVGDRGCRASAAPRTSRTESSNMDIQPDDFTIAKQVTAGFFSQGSLLSELFRYRWSEFDCPVPFREASFFYESRLQKEDGSVNKGMFGRSVRLLPDAEYSLILAAGFETGTAERKRFVIREGVHPDPGRLDLTDRPIIERLSRRPFRDRVFSTGIKRAYDNTCAISGLRIINGGGRAEAQAAHIRPVHDNGPDSLRNGVALSSTFHWMFDRGLISIDDDFSLLFKRNAVPGNVLSMVNRDGRLRVPEQEIYRPHRRFLEYHREHVFKG